MKNGDGLIIRWTLSGLALTTSVAAASCFLAVWSYWSAELDADCGAGRDCGCVLFGTSFAGGTFVGGEQYACRFVWHATMASAALAACACAGHGCGWLQRSAGRRRQDRQSAVVRPPDTSPQITGLQMCFIIIFGFMALVMFITSIVLSNGYISTCQQYMHRVKNILLATGNMVELITNRMSCGTIYDFLDYLQPPSQQVVYELIYRHRTNPRNSIINTSLLLIISIIMSWLNTLIWIFFSICIYYYK